MYLVFYSMRKEVFNTDQNQETYGSDNIMLWKSLILSQHE